MFGLGLLPGGVIADKYSKKNTMILSLILTPISFIFVILSSNSIVLLGAFAIGGLMSGGITGALLEPARIAYIADKVKPEKLYKSYALYHGSWLLGTGGGALLALVPELLQTKFLYDIFLSYKISFFIGIIISLFSIFVISSISKDLGQNKNMGSLKELYHSYRKLYSLKEKIDLRNLCILFLVWGSGFMVVPLIPVWFNLQFGVFESSIAIWFALFNIGSVPILIISNKLKKRTIIPKIMIAIQVVSSVALVLMPTSNNFIVAGLCLVTMMILFNFISPLFHSWAIPRFKPEVRGMTIAVLFTMWSITSGITPAIAGYMFDKSLLALPFIISASLLLIAGFCFYIINTKTPP